MTTGLDTLATALHLKIDDMLKAAPRLAPWRPRVGITPKPSDAEPAGWAEYGYCASESGADTTATEARVGPEVVDRSPVRDEPVGITPEDDPVHGHCAPGRTGVHRSSVRVVRTPRAFPNPRHTPRMH